MRGVGVGGICSWEPPKSMAGFLEKHFNRCLEDSEKEAILKDFPKPAVTAR